MMIVMQFARAAGQSARARWLCRTCGIWSCSIEHAWQTAFSLDRRDIVPGWHAECPIRIVRPDRQTVREVYDEFPAY